MNRVYHSAETYRPARSMFNLSYDKKFTCDMGQLIPVQVDEVYPGDVWKMGVQAAIRMQPTVAPIMHEVNVYFHTFFCPNRILWNEQVQEEEGSWEEFITGGIDGLDDTTMITWNATDRAVNSLWDYMGLPVGVDCDGLSITDLPKRAYNKIINDYYLDETLDTPLDIAAAESIQNRRWQGDRFTKALPFQQRGTMPALPVTVSGTTSAVWDSGMFNVITGDPFYYVGLNSDNGGEFVTNGSTYRNYMERAFNENEVDLSAGIATTFDVADLRLAFQIQKFLERNARSGVRLTEFLQAHFGVSPRDERLDRPEFIGGTRSPLITSEVLQTSATDVDSPQGNLAGHGIAVPDGYLGKYAVVEHGWIITLMSIMPKPVYQTGVPRQWIKETKYDYMFPEFVSLSEVPVYKGELLAKDADSTWNTGIFGYQGIYDEMRTKDSMVVGEMRSTFDYWHISRKWDPSTDSPELNSTFLTCTPRKDIFAVQDVPGFICNVGNKIKAFRPIPVIATPGLIDHH